VPTISGDKLIAIEQNKIVVWELSNVLDPTNETPESNTIEEGNDIWFNCTLNVGSDVSRARDVEEKKAKAKEGEQREGEKGERRKSLSFL
jgi:hypothetical protein